MRDQEGKKALDSRPKRKRSIDAGEHASPSRPTGPVTPTPAANPAPTPATRSGPLVPVTTSGIAPPPYDPRDVQYKHKHPRSPDVHQFDPRSYHNWIVEFRERDPDFPEGVAPISQAALTRGNHRANWVMGVQFQARHDGVNQATLPLSPVKAHGVDPFGRPFVYMAMNNRFARRDQQNIGGRVYMICVLIRRDDEFSWLQHPAAFAQQVNMLQRYGRRRALFNDNTLLPTSETLRVERIPWEQRTEHEKRDNL